MPHNIFILHDNDGLIPLLEQEYESEAIFQTMLTNYPELLLFSDERTPYSNLLLIKQEQGVPVDINGGIYHVITDCSTARCANMNAISAHMRRYTNDIRISVPEKINSSPRALK